MALPILYSNEPEESSISLSSDRLSVTMRIPAEMAYIGNASLTLRGICDHVALAAERANRIVLAMEEALVNAIEHAYDGEGGVIDLEFSVEEAELKLIIEDFGCGLPEVSAVCYDDILRDRGRGLVLIQEIPDDVTIDSVKGKGTKTSMLFSLANCD